MRGTILSRWKELGLKAPPDKGDNVRALHLQRDALRPMPA